MAISKIVTNSVDSGAVALTTQVTGTLPVANGGTGVTTSTGTGANVLGTSPSISGAVLSTMASSVITSGTAVASTSGTSIDFTSIPSWVKRITVMFNGVSTNGTANPLFQVGSGSVATTGYLSSNALANSGATAVGTNTNGFGTQFGSAANTLYGTLVIYSFGSNIYVASYSLSASNSGSGQLGSGGITLGGALDRVRITTSNGTDTFDAGSINILYE